MPVPLQVRAGVNAVPLHIAAAHCDPAAYRRQAPAPLHSPSVLQLALPRFAHWFNGSAPAATLVHVPTDPASAQDWQVPAHAVAQQTPWAQTFDSHSPAAAHAAPTGFVVQLPPMQVNGATQSLLTAHVVRHAPAPQA